MPPRFFEVVSLHEDPASRGNDIGQRSCEESRS